MAVGEQSTRNDDVLREFRDTSLPVQFGLGIAAALGMLAALGIFKLWLAGQVALCLTAAAGLVLGGVGLGLVYYWFCRPVVLQQLADGLVLRRGDEATPLPFERLAGFSVSWRDILRNGVYQNTLVRFRFENVAGQEFRHTSTAMYQTQKYEDLEQLQRDLSVVVAERLEAELRSKGRLPWTDRLTLREDAIEFKKRPADEPRLVEFSRITYCEIDQGLLKIAIAGSRKPNIVEKTDGLNFYPGLLLYENLSSQIMLQSELHEELQPAV